MKKTQCEKILEYMRRYGSITTLDAMLDLSIMRLASRIHDLKVQGYKISSETVTAKNRHGEPVSFKKYKLIEEE